jgi:hypothetical protein
LGFQKNINAYFYLKYYTKILVKPFCEKQRKSSMPNGSVEFQRKCKIRMGHKKFEDMTNVRAPGNTGAILHTDRKRQ